ADATDGAIAADNPVACERTLLDRESVAVADAAARANANERIVVADGAAIAADGLVARDRTIGDAASARRVVDGTAKRVSTPAAEGLVVGKRTARHAGGAAGPAPPVFDAPARPAGAAGATQGLVLSELGAADGRDGTEFIIERTANTDEKRVAAGADGLVGSK